MNEVDGEKSANGKVCVSDHFRTLFCGPQFEVGDGYFYQGKSSRESKFERHVTKCRKPLQHFALQRKVFENFLLSKVEATAPIEKSRSFPLKLCCLCFSVCTFANGIDFP